MKAAAPSTLGYRLVLPPGWVALPLASGACGPAVSGLVDRAVATAPAALPPDTLAKLRRTVEGRLLATVRSAQQAGGTELYLPVERLHGVLVPASFVVAETTVEGDGPELDPVAVLARLVAAHDGVRAVEVDGCVGVRTLREVAASEEAELGVRAASRHVEYVLAPPFWPGRWVSIAYSTLVVPDDDQGLTELFVALFDAVMTTWHWEAA